MRTPKGPESYPVHVAEQSLRIGIDPQNGPRDVQAGDQYLDVNLKGKRIVALLVEAQKSDDAPLQMMTNEIKLVLPDGTELHPVSSPEAANKGKRSAALIVFPWVVPLISPLGIVLSAVFRGKANRNMRSDFAQKALPHPCSLSKEQPALGYVYFILPSKAKTLKGAKVLVPVANSSTNERVVVEQLM